MAPAVLVASLILYTSERLCEAEAVLGQGPQATKVNETESVGNQLVGHQILFIFHYGDWAF